MDVPRSGRTLTILWLALVCFGPYFTLPVQSHEQPACREYPSDVHCGLSMKYGLNATSLLKQSSEALQGEFPWHVAIFHKRNGRPSYSCGGSLLSDQFVLTAAHCVTHTNNGSLLSEDTFHLKLGYHELNVTEEGCSQDVGVKVVHKHPDYTHKNIWHDLAILKLERSVRFNDRVLPICLDMDDDYETDAFYRNVGKVPGWGYTEFDAGSDWLRMTNVPIVNDTHCLSSNRNVFGKTIHHGIFCGGYANGTNVCKGDSGGGLVTFHNTTRLLWKLQGIVSFTVSGVTLVCDTHQYAGFVKVRYYKDWINSILTGEIELTNTNETERGTLPKTKASSKLPTDCGKRQISTMPTIVNGVRSLEGEFPWHAAIIGVFERSRKYLCGGTLLSAKFILTSASCVTDWQQQHRQLFVQLGQRKLSQSSITGRDVRVLDVEKTGDSSIALLTLEVDVQYSDYIQPICIPTTAGAVDSKAAASRIGKVGRIIGFGETELNGRLSDDLQTATMPIVDSELCVMRGILDARSAVKMFCAGHGNGTGPCKGDEGGGFYEINEHGVWTLTGVIKLHGEGCDTKGYIRLFDVLFYNEWLTNSIESILTKHTNTVNGMVYFHTALIVLFLFVSIIVSLLMLRLRRKRKPLAVTVLLQGSQSAPEGDRLRFETTQASANPIISGDTICTK